MRTDPCGTSIRFEKLPFGGGWWITCPGCARMPADDVYPRAILDEIDRWAVRGEITLTRFLEVTGSCP